MGQWQYGSSTRMTAIYDAANREIQDVAIKAGSAVAELKRLMAKR